MTDSNKDNEGEDRQLTFDEAQSLVAFHSSTKIPMHPKTYQACLDAYRAAGVEP